MSLYIPDFEVMNSKEIMACLSINLPTLHLDIKCQYAYLPFFDDFFKSDIYKLFKEYYLKKEDYSQVGIELLQIGYLCTKKWNMAEIKTCDDLCEYLRPMYEIKEGIFDKNEKRLVSNLEKTGTLPAVDIMKMAQKILDKNANDAKYKSDDRSVIWYKESLQIDEYVYAMFYTGMWYYISKFGYKDGIDSKIEAYMVKTRFRVSENAKKIMEEKILPEYYTSYQKTSMFLFHSMEKEQDVLEYIMMDLKEYYSNKQPDNRNFTLDALRLAFFAGIVIKFMRLDYANGEEFYEKIIKDNGFIDFDQKVVPRYEETLKAKYKELQQICLQLSVECLHLFSSEDNIVLDLEDFVDCVETMYYLGKCIACSKASPDVRL